MNPDIHFISILVLIRMGKAERDRMPSGRKAIQHQSDPILSGKRPGQDLASIQPEMDKRTGISAYPEHGPIEPQETDLRTFDMKVLRILLTGFDHPGEENKQEDTENRFYAGD